MKSIFFLMLIIFSLSHLITSQNSAKDFVDAHNSARTAVKVGPVSWNETVATYAENYANKSISDCNPVNSGGAYGENVFRGTGKPWTGKEAVDVWVSTKEYYNYNNNSCATSVQNCTTYTQVVWAKSVYIGCARVVCASGAIFVVCNYDPPGNVLGEKPY